MPDLQSSEAGFESLFVTVSKIGNFRSLHWCPGSLSCINEYLAIDRNGNVSDLALARNCFLEKPSWCRNEQVCHAGEAKSVKRFERSNGLDTALYKNYIYLFFTFLDGHSIWKLQFPPPHVLPPHLTVPILDLGYLTHLNIFLLCCCFRSLS